jgi:hypothetical protein
MYRIPPFTSAGAAKDGLMITFLVFSTILFVKSASLPLKAVVMISSSSTAGALSGSSIADMEAG